MKMVLSYLITVLFFMLIAHILIAAPAVTADKVKKCWLLLLVLLLCWPVQAIQKGGSGSNNGEKINGSLEVSSVLVVAGTIESASGGIKFPNGTIQLTAFSSSETMMKSGDTLTGTLTIDAAGADLIVNQGEIGIGTKETTAALDINGSTGYNQLRLRTTFTPSSASDTRGDVGDIAWDSNYIYVKTSTGWKRAFITGW